MRPVTEDELPAFVNAVEAAFGYVPPDEEADLWRRGTDPSRTLAVFDAGEIVGTAGAWAMEMTLPGLVSVPVAGVTAVGVQPTHRRQGLLTRMMERQLDDCLSWNEPIAILTASEAVIYGRFGYGWATSLVAAEVSTDHGAFAVPVDVGGRMRRINKEAAGKIAPPLYERARRRTSGDATMVPIFWEFMTLDLEHRRDGASALFFAVHESAAGEPDGFVSYRYKEKWQNGNPASTVIVTELFGDSPGVEAALFRYLLDLDLVAQVKFHNRPVGDHLQRRLANPRRYSVTGVGDHVWVRLVDVAAALPLRRYTTDGSVVLQVHDRFRPANEGTYLLEGGPDGAICARISGSGSGASGASASGAPASAGAGSGAPDVELPVDSLGAAFLGGVSFTSLAEAGRAVERKPGGLRRADAMFLTDTPPYCRTGF